MGDSWGEGNSPSFADRATRTGNYERIGPDSPETAGEPAEASALDRLAIPRDPDALGIPEALLHDLVLRSALVAGKTSTIELAERLKLNPVLMTRTVEQLRDLKLIEVSGIEGRNYRLNLTGEGRATATERLQLCRYVGPAPVSLEDYSAVIRHQHAEPVYDLDSLRDAFGDLVISDKLLSEVGPAAMGSGAMFLYGPPGTGKSSIAERLQRVHNDAVFVPYSIAVDGQIITIFDPVVHRPVDEQFVDVDQRWVLCQRPFITVGGELTARQLDLSYQESSGTYLAPLQVQANNGILVIDDFGRQALKPEDLLNRWIVPLDRGVDYLSLEYGVKFEVPFNSKIVFSTNLEPETLGDEAFFRRIQSKVLIPTIRDEAFEEVLYRVAESRGVELTPDAPTHLRWMSRQLGDGDLRPYLPGAVISILEAICRFENRPLLLDPPMVERIANMYFTRSTDSDEFTDLASTAKEAPPDEPDLPFTKPQSSIFGAKTGGDDEKKAEVDDAMSRRFADVAAKALAAVQSEMAGEEPDDGSDDVESVEA